MARLIDPPEDFNNKPTGVPPVPPEAHPRANFKQRKFIVAAFLKDTLVTGDDAKARAAIQFFLGRFVENELEGAGYWTWGESVGWAKCEVCHREQACILAVWNCLEDDHA